MADLILFLEESGLDFTNPPQNLGELIVWLAKLGIFMVVLALVFGVFGRISDYFFRWNGD